MATQERFLRMKQVMDITGLSRSGIYKQMETGDFPKQFKVGSGNFAARWSEVELLAWMDRQKENR